MVGRAHGKRRTIEDVVPILRAFQSSGQCVDRKVFADPLQQIDDEARRGVAASPR